MTVCACGDHTDDPLGICATCRITPSEVQSARLASEHHPAPIPFRRGDYAHITYKGRTVVAFVAMASANGGSLMLMFDAMLGGYVGVMPVNWINDHYEDVMTNGLVHLMRFDTTIEIDQPVVTSVEEGSACAAFHPDHNGECLNCDDWADAHSPEAIKAGEKKEGH